MRWIDTVIDFVSMPSIGRAIVFALIGGVMLTQWIKFQMPEWWSDKTHQRMVRILSSVLTFALCLTLFPEDYWWVTLAIAVVTGLAAPTVYWLVVKCLYHYLPWTEEVLSARPTPDENADHA